MIAVKLHNSDSISVLEIPCLPENEWHSSVCEMLKNKMRLCALFGKQEGQKIKLFTVLAKDQENVFYALSTKVEREYPSLTEKFPQAQTFERELAENFGLMPQGHPYLKPLRKIQPFPFFQMKSEETHEVAVGPVHAGIIEPGHFRFQCFGEHVFNLEISLGYQHRGIEKALVGGPHKRTPFYMETIAGDTSVAHALAYSQIMESLCHIVPPSGEHQLRAIALELERIANHTGDLGALAGDVGFLPTASFCGRLRGDFLNLTALICGNRLGRGIIRPGGVGNHCQWPDVHQFLRKLSHARKEVKEAASLLWHSPSVLSRFENTGTLSSKSCHDLGVVGLAARASDVWRDVRRDFPTGSYVNSKIRLSVRHSGDVFARARMRWLEIDASTDFILEQLENLEKRGNQVPPLTIAPNQFVVSAVEGWRGEVIHVALTDEKGRFEIYKVVDPSFHNWMGLALALRNQQISDFPLCNKSFNLSYCGHDL